MKSMMDKKTDKFFAAAIWDDDRKTFYSVSNIKGLYIVAATIEEFEEVFDDVAAELILANHTESSPYILQTAQGLGY